MKEASKSFGPTPALRSPGPMPPDPEQPEPAPTPFPFPIPQVNGDANPASAGDESFGVLLVDDNHHHRIPLIAALRKEGYWLLHAAGGASAEAISRASQHPIHLLIVRETMKRMDGAELARRMSRQHPNIQVLFMRHPSDRSTPEGAEPTPTSEGSDSALIQDPFTPSELSLRVSELLESSR